MYLSEQDFLLRPVLRPVLMPVLSAPRADASLGRATNAGAQIRMAALQFLENSDRPQPRC
jgi:hypothetical protein